MTDGAMEEGKNKSEERRKEKGINGGRTIKDNDGEE